MMKILRCESELERALQERDAARAELAQIKVLNNKANDLLILVAERDEALSQLNAIITELKNFELNGSDPVKQIRNMYLDMDELSNRYREREKELARLRGLIGEFESPSQTDFYPCRCEDGEKCLICRLVEAAKGDGK